MQKWLKRIKNFIFFLCVANVLVFINILFFRYYTIEEHLLSLIYLIVVFLAFLFFFILIFVLDASNKRSIAMSLDTIAFDEKTKDKIEKYKKELSDFFDD